MAAVTFTAAQIAPVFPAKAEIFSAIAGTAITAGDACYYGTAGFAQRTAAATGGAATNDFDGLALKGAGSAGVTDIIRRGHVYGFNLSSIPYGGTVYAGTAVGTFDDSAVGGTVIVGVVVPLTDPDRTKVLYVNAPWR